MKRSDRILTTHVGSLPRPEPTAELLLAKDQGEPYDAAAFDRSGRAPRSTRSVRRQVAAGIDIVNDGELCKLGYSTYIIERLDRLRRPCARKPRARHRRAFPSFSAALARDDGRAGVHAAPPASGRSRCATRRRATTISPIRRARAQCVRRERLS